MEEKRKPNHHKNRPVVSVGGRFIGKLSKTFGTQDLCDNKKLSAMSWEEFVRDREAHYEEQTHVFSWAQGQLSEDMADEESTSNDLLNDHRNIFHVAVKNNTFYQAINAMNIFKQQYPEQAWKCRKENSKFSNFIDYLLCFVFQTDSTELLSQCVNNLPFFEKLSPVHCAIQFKALNCIEYLLNLFPEHINTPDASGYLPLSYAVMTREKKIVALLLDKGANSKHKDMFGRLPIEYAQDNNIEDMLNTECAWPSSQVMNGHFTALMPRIKNRGALLLERSTLLSQMFIPECESIDYEGKKTSRNNIVGKFLSRRVEEKEEEEDVSELKRGYSIIENKIELCGKSRKMLAYLNSDETLDQKCCYLKTILVDKDFEYSEKTFLFMVKAAGKLSITDTLFQMLVDSKTFREFATILRVLEKIFTLKKYCFDYFMYLKNKNVKSVWKYRNNDEHGLLVVLANMLTPKHVYGLKKVAIKKLEEILNDEELMHLRNQREMAMTPAQIIQHQYYTIFSKKDPDPEILNFFQIRKS